MKENRLKEMAKDLKINTGILHSNPVLIMEESFISGYNQGMKEAFEWIPVEKELPEHRKLVLVKGDKCGEQIPCLVGWWYNPHWVIVGEEEISFGEVTHWRQINQEDMP